MSQGFLGYHATFMLDVVVCALVLLVPALATSIYLVKFRRQYAWHRRLQLTLAAVLFLAVAAFEVDVQLVHHGWQNIVKDARPDMAAESLDFARKVLYVHLVFAISTPLLWILTISLALPKFGNPPFPSRHSPVHKLLGWCSATDLALTSATGLLFYYFAFIAR
jgi:putative membrane protein